MQLLTTSIASTLGASLLICCSSSVCAQTADFTFDTTPIGAFSPLTLTQNGITAIFTDDFGLPHGGYGLYDDGQFAVEASGGGDGFYSSAFSGHDLSSSAGYAGQGHPLVILFNRPISSISLDFALTERYTTSAPMTFTADNGSLSLETQSLTAAPAPACWFPEGKVSYHSAQPFNKIELAADLSPGMPPSFLIVDNVQVTAAAAPVPEASTVVSLGLLLTLGLSGLAVSKRRRSAQTDL